MTELNVVSVRVNSFYNMIICHLRHCNAKELLGSRPVDMMTDNSKLAHRLCVSVWQF